MSDKLTEKIEEKPIFNDDQPVFKLEGVTGVKDLYVTSKKDDNGDYPVMFLIFKDDEDKEHKIGIWRDEMAAVTFVLAREDQQSKLLNARFKEYKEVPVRLVIQTNKDIKKGDYVVAWRKERVPLDFNYTKL